MSPPARGRVPLSLPFLLRPMGLGVRVQSSNPRTPRHLPHLPMTVPHGAFLWEVLLGSGAGLASGTGPVEGGCGRPCQVVGPWSVPVSEAASPEKPACVFKSSTGAVLPYHQQPPPDARLGAPDPVDTCCDPQKASPTPEILMTEDGTDTGAERHSDPGCSPEETLQGTGPFFLFRRLFIYLKGREGEISSVLCFNPPNGSSGQSWVGLKPGAWSFLRSPA